MPKNLFYTDGNSMKGIDLPQYNDSAWEWSSGKPETNNDDLYAKVAAVFRTCNLTAEAIASLPFALIQGKTDFDVSDDWQNKVGFMPNPREILRLWRMSLFMTNTAYGFMEGNRAVKNLRYIVPTTIQPIVDSGVGLTGFKRTIGNQSTEYSLKDNRIFYMWRRDHTTELLPAAATEFKALMAAAGVLFYSDYYVQSFFQRGGIKPTMLLVKGMADPTAREKIEGMWDKLMRGMSKYLGKVWNAESIEPVVIGEGIDNIKDSVLHEDKIADIALAAGIPLSLLLANSASFATAKVEYLSWFRNSVIPWSIYMGDCMNDQLFTPLGLKFEFRPELTDHGQEEEVERSQAYGNYITAKMKPSVAAQILGIDLPPGMSFEQLDIDFEEMTPAPVPIVMQEPEPTTDDGDEETPDEDEVKSEPNVPTLDYFRELKCWETKAIRKFKQGKSPDFPFVCKVVPETVASAIRSRLPECKSVQDIIDAFELTPREDDGLLALADALNRAVEAHIDA
jgi:hypothetical protein